MIFKKLLFFLTKDTRILLFLVDFIQSKLILLNIKVPSINMYTSKCFLKKKNIFILNIIYNYLIIFR